jgi:NAD(P)H-hydrate epimerase
MATGGMGDVLSGLIGSLLVQGYTPWDASGIGVYMHGLAADLLAEERPNGYWHRKLRQHCHWQPKR